jgi:hypothetical protein
MRRGSGGSTVREEGEEHDGPWAELAAMELARGDSELGDVDEEEGMYDKWGRGGKGS